ncbi:unnamed protein product [Phyllotreta striolata]|uniref:Bromodomain adjacent to zinc finger domain protein 1A n=1 Tax=Phyllotreta striolata TaxID=444603 RepID=A0A9N9XM40_PHYSR|nr:unnamed protein product [Phyllotreta striolata]
MPLLKKKVFEKHTISDEHLRDDEEVFYCEITNEIFRDYEEFAERMFLYNSMVWTCSMTGKQNLTYQEALESEENARQNLKEFPLELRLPILYLASKTHRTSFADMADDVFNYVKDRYFIGENLETSFTTNKWKDSHVLQVIAPSEDTVKTSPKNGSKTDHHFWPPANLFKYEIEHLDAYDSDISEIMIVDCNQMRRRKGSFNRDKCKLFLKQYVEHDARGLFAVKPSVIGELAIDKMKFEQIFDGPPPDFAASKRKERTSNNGKKKLSQETLAKYLTKMNNGDEASPKSREKNLELSERMRKREEQFKAKQLLKQEEKIALKNKQKRDSITLNNVIKQWLLPKEDTQLENQRKLPLFTPVKTKIPDRHFGDVLMIMEFVESFSKLLSTKDFFPQGINLELMERAMFEKEIAGPLTDLVQMFLAAIFNVQEEESSQYRTALENPTDIKNEDVLDNLSLTDATRLATSASSWSKRYQGLPLGRLPLYSVTVSEVLRLHLLSSGARINEQGAKWRYAQRGGYTSEDDPGLHLRLERPRILKALATHNLVQLSMRDKIRILSCLMNQLLTFADVRDVIEERFEANRRLKIDLKAAQLAEKKAAQELAAAKQKAQKEMKGDQRGAQEALDKLDRDAEKKRGENERKIAKLIGGIYKGQTYLGSDRAHRKYLKINSIPAIFVNDEREETLPCDDAICKQNPHLVNVSKSQLTKYMRKFHIDVETPVDNPSNSPKSPKKPNGILSTGSPKDDALELLMCTADPGDCPVHSCNDSSTKWWFISDEHHVQELENSLNKRGVREGELLQAIKDDKAHLTSIVAQTPVNLLNPDVVVDVKIDEEQALGRRSKRGKDRYEDSNLGYPASMPSEEVLENALLDNVLEMEEKIYAGNLGSLGVKNRDEWRRHLQNKRYGDLDKTIVKREPSKSLLKVKKDKNSRSPTPELPAKSKLKDYQDPGRFLGDIDGHEANENEENEEENYLITTDSMRTSVSSLAIALAQVAHAVDHKYLKKPLGNADASKTDKKPHQQLLDNWEQSLLASTSYSQVFLHYGTLDSCVMWSRSALLARCRICRRQKDSENMLLCDNCNLGHHLYCLKPTLTSVPKGDWFCDRCKKEKEAEAQLLSPTPATPTKKRRIFRDEDVEDEETESKSTDNESHSDNVAADADEEEDSSDEDGSIDEGQSQKESRPVKFSLCKHCNSGGELVNCEKCLYHWHIECCDPPLRRIPRGPWTCWPCKSGAKKRQRERTDSDSDDESFGSSNVRRGSHLREDLPLHNASLQELLGDVMKHPDAWAFIRPVTKSEVPDYFDIIAKPMDFGTIKYKLNMGVYRKDGDFMEDAVLVFVNCNTYNDRDAEVYKCGVRLLKFFEKKAKELGLKLPEEMTSDDPAPHRSRKKQRSK